ncbi:MULTISPECIES: SHOCT domain-containing protein [Enterococcus]|uniref:SHOCT domain-containing protein n=1 Tax=Enterococcus TaxID=1350 RepID=UPI00158638E1|nr:MULTISPECIES: SHOCT domain-containing protein [Enterococcus]MDO7879945.1 SHOCT domain-containing protein [Enterococcus mundtii]
MDMGLFSSKADKEKAKREKENRKAENEKILEYFKNHSDYNVGDMYFDDKHGKIFIKKSLTMNRSQAVYNYDELISYTPIFEGGKIKKHHGITRAIVGGVIAGPVGAVVGAGTGGKEFDTIKRLGFILHLTENRSQNYMLIISESKTDSFLTKSTLEDYNNIAAKLDQIISSNTKESFPSGSDADELRKFKGLLDDGIITQEEFDEKKKELLG